MTRPSGRVLSAGGAARAHRADRLTLGVLGLIAVLVLGLSLLETVQLRGFLVDSEATRVRAQAKALVDAAAATTGFGSAQAVALATDLTAADTGALVLAPDGSVLGRPRPGTVGAPAPTDIPADAVTRAVAGDREVDIIRAGTAGRELLVLVPEPGARPPRAVIALVTSLADEDAIAAQQVVSGLAALGAVLVLAAVGSLLLVARSLRPLRRISATAAAVAAGDLDQRVHLGGPADEIGRLGESFDTMTAALQHTIVELERSEQRSRAFVADASHELRTPLTTVAGFTDVLLRRPTTDDDTARLLAALRREVDRMQCVVNDLLLLAQLDRGLDTTRDPVDLHDAAQRVVEQLQPGAGARRLLADGSPVLAATDPDRLHRILLNLVTNAMRHTAPDGTITLTSTGTTGRAVLTVVDDGEGMDEATRRVAFERFTRGTTRRGDGAGLGLAIVAGLADELGGQVHLDSRPGHGTTVRLTLPAPTIPTATPPATTTGVAP